MSPLVLKDNNNSKYVLLTLLLSVSLGEKSFSLFFSENIGKSKFQTNLFPKEKKSKEEVKKNFSQEKFTKFEFQILGSRLTLKTTKQTWRKSDPWTFGFLSQLVKYFFEVFSCDSQTEIGSILYLGINWRKLNLR